MHQTLPVSIAHQIAAEFIDSGLLHPGDQLPSVRELQRRYGASNASIAHALSILQAQSVVVKMHGKGCFVAGGTTLAAAETEATPGPMQTIAYVIPDNFGQSPLLMQIYKGIEQAARRAQYHTLVVTHRDYESERQQIQQLTERGCDGIVLYPCIRVQNQLDNDYLARELTDYPIVLVDLAYPAQQRPHVVFDNYQAGYQMTRLLLGRGHRRIAFMVPHWAPEPLKYRSVEDRLQGYRDAYQEAGLTPHPDDIWNMVTGGGRFDVDARAFMGEWKTKTERPTALIALEDSIALFLMHLSRELGIRVPEDLVIVGFDNVLYSRIQVAPFLTTQPDFIGAGDVAVRLLLRLIHGEKLGTATYLLPVPIRERESQILKSGESLVPAGLR